MGGLDELCHFLGKKGGYHCYEHLKARVEILKLEFKFLKMFVRGMAYYWQELIYDSRSKLTMLTLASTMIQKEEEIVSDCKIVEGLNQSLDLEAVISDLEKLVDEQLKPQTKDICRFALGGSYKCMYCPPNREYFLEDGRDISSFLELILQNLRELQKSNLLAPVMKQHITLLKGKLEEFGMYVDPINPSITQVKKLYELTSCARTWFSRISCLTYLYWSDGKDESMASTMTSLLSGLLQKTMSFSTSGIISSYSQPTLIPQLLAHHLDFILEDLALCMKADIENLQEGLIFMLSFIVDPPQNDSEDKEMIFTQIYAVINEFSSFHYLILSGGIEEGFSKANFSDFLLEIDAVKAQVKKNYLVIPYSLQLPAPNINATRFLNSLIEKLKKILGMEVEYIPYLMHQYELVLKELASLRLLVENMAKLKDTDEQDGIISVVYNADYVIKVSLLRNVSAWYGIIALPHVIEQIKYVKNGVHELYNKKRLGHDDQMDGAMALQPQGTTSKIENDCMGFMEDERIIMDELRRGQKSLTIISISGSGGQGKTTFARRIYNNANVQCHFQKRVWCYVSSDCSVIEILKHILCGAIEGVSCSKLGVQDLVEHVRKSLKGRRYLIVMDDIWDIDSWEQLESSFPDDKNGSRILFTSRNHDLALQVKSNSISHSLPLFSDEESWELVKKRVFDLDICDEELVGIGRKIASSCKGLPLALVLAAAVLGRTRKDLDSWSKVAENLKEHLAHEGCGKVIELSYKCLPDHLKSCFLYFGVFRRGKHVRAATLKLLWIGEGFIIVDGEAKSTEEDLATEYLKDLVSQGLVVATEWSSMGEIKGCNVHDLLYDLCLEKCKEENFLNWMENVGIWDLIFGVDRDDTNYTISRKCSHHRLVIHATDPFIKSSSIVSRWELPTHALHSFLWSQRYLGANTESSLQILATFKIITVLKLRLAFTDKFPEVILSSLHLRYLALKFMGSIRAVPRAIAKLLELRTLIILWCSLRSTRPVCSASLPACLWIMKRLRHVHVKYAVSESEDFNLKNPRMVNFETVGKLRLHEDDRTTADSLWRFPNLKKLSCDISIGSRNNILGWLSMVGSLLTQLQSLKVDCTDLMEEDSYPYEGNPNPVISKLGNLKKLTLYGTEIPWSVVSEIGKQIPDLRVLKLHEHSCVGGSWTLKDGDFSKLIYLNLDCLDIEEIDVSSCEDNHPFPHLEHLVLKDCKFLKEIPLVFGEICSLKKIHVVCGCKTEVTTSAMQILDEQRDFGNHSLQVIIGREYADEEEPEVDNEDEEEQKVEGEETDEEEREVEDEDEDDCASNKPGKVA